MDYKSLMGYAHNSPYRNAPYLDIKTPEGLITTENTPIDLLGIPNVGTPQVMKKGRKKPYEFPNATKVTEIPMKGNPYQQGGPTSAQLFKFLFDDEEETSNTKAPTTTAPTVAEVEEQVPVRDNSEDEMAMQIATSEFGNPYNRRRQFEAEHQQFIGEILSSGQHGNQNVGEYGRQIYGQLTQDLGYAPVANSIYRDQRQQNELISKGIGAKNSYHLTGDAVDIKPQDWHKLSSEKQQYYRMNYDVVYHNNHYHIEPKNK